jgi:hypothetical protein
LIGLRPASVDGPGPSRGNVAPWMDDDASAELGLCAPAATDQGGSALQSPLHRVEDDDSFDDADASGGVRHIFSG